MDVRHLCNTPGCSGLWTVAAEPLDDGFLLVELQLGERSAVSSGWGLTLSNQLANWLDMDSEEVGIFEAKTHLSQLVDRVESTGVTYRITRRGKPVAELSAIKQETVPRLRFGYGRRSGNFVSEDFDSPIDDFSAYE